MNTPISTSERFFPSPQYKTVHKGLMVSSQHYLKQSPMNQVPDASLRPQMVPQTPDSISGACYSMMSPDAAGANVMYSSSGNMSHSEVSNRQSVIQPTPIRTYRPHQHHRYLIPGSNIISHNSASPQQMVATGGLVGPRVAGINKYIIPNHSAYHPMQSAMGKRYFMRTPAGVIQAAASSKVHPQSALHVNTRGESLNSYFIFQPIIIFHTARGIYCALKTSIFTSPNYVLILVTTVFFSDPCTTDTSS